MQGAARVACDGIIAAHPVEECGLEGVGHRIVVRLRYGPEVTPRQAEEMAVRMADAVVERTWPHSLVGVRLEGPRQAWSWDVEDLLPCGWEHDTDAGYDLCAKQAATVRPR